MAVVNSEAEFFPASAADSISNNVGGRSSDSMEVQNNSVSDEGSVKHFSANWEIASSEKEPSVGLYYCVLGPQCLRPMPTSAGLNIVTPGSNQFAIYYKGSICVYDGIPAEKVHEIMLIAAASAKSAELKSGIPFTSLFPAIPSSPQGTSNNLPSPQSVCFPAEKSSICRLQEFPIARRQSLQRFLEKRRIRLGSRAPYTSSSARAANNTENNFCADNTPDFNDQRKDFSPVLLPLEGN